MVYLDKLPDHTLTQAYSMYANLGRFTHFRCLEVCMRCRKLIGGLTLAHLYYKAVQFSGEDDFEGHV